MTSPSQNKSKVKVVEEIFNSILHGLGAIAAIVGLIIGVITISSSVSFKMGFIIYCACLILLMLMSCLYHALKFTKAIKVFRALDHSSIFLLIAGSFTPFIIQLYSGWLQIVLLSVTWAIAVAGVTLSPTVILPKGLKKTNAFLYIAFGWLALIFVPKIHLFSVAVLWLLVAGGVVYTLGVIFYASKKPFMHFSWHICVMAGAILHFFAIIKLP
jgi:hemolysin III